MNGTSPRAGVADDVTYVVLGGTGHIGSATAVTLLRGTRRVRVVTRSPDKAAAWAARGAEPVVADLEDERAMAGVLSSPSPVRVFALNPPGSIDSDPDLEEDRTADAIVAAVAAANVERVVALSTYGARPGRRIGDLGTLHRFETLLHDLDVPVAVVRAGYLYSNWDGAAESVRARGQLPIMLDPGRALPMVAPADVGGEAARLLLLGTPDRGTHHVEGPRRYTPADVARTFAEVLGTPVTTARTPREDWTSTFRAFGFSAAAADSFTGLTALVSSETWETPGEPTRGPTTLETYVSALTSTAAETGAGEDPARSGPADPTV